MGERGGAGQRLGGVGGGKVGGGGGFVLVVGVEKPDEEEREKGENCGHGWGDGSEHGP